MESDKPPFGIRLLVHFIQFKTVNYGFLNVFVKKREFTAIHDRNDFKDNNREVDGTDYEETVTATT